MVQQLHHQSLRRAARAPINEPEKPFMSRTTQEQVVHFLSDLYSVEQQALAQLNTAPQYAGDPGLEVAYREHLIETEAQSASVGERLEALGGSASKVKDAIMRAGGKGFLLFARLMPETPGRLLTHSYSYEAMEWAGYEILIRFARHAGDDETVQVAQSIQAQERAMMHRLEAGFDAAEKASHAALSSEEQHQHVRRHLAEVHAFEKQGSELLEKSKTLAADAAVAEYYHHAQAVIRRHAQMVETRLKQLESGPSMFEDQSLRGAALNWSLFFQAQSDTPAKLAAFVYAVLHLQIGGVELLKRTANRTGDINTRELCEVILSELQGLAERLVEQFETTVEATLHTVSAH